MGWWAVGGVSFGTGNENNKARASAFISFLAVPGRRGGVLDRHQSSSAICNVGGRRRWLFGQGSLHFAVIARGHFFGRCCLGRRSLNRRAAFRISLRLGGWRLVLLDGLALHGRKLSAVTDQLLNERSL